MAKVSLPKDLEAKSGSVLIWILNRLQVRTLPGLGEILCLLQFSKS